jgi:AAA domain
MTSDPFMEIADDLDAKPPWLTHPKYQGMSERSARLSYEASRERHGGAETNAEKSGPPPLLQSSAEFTRGFVPPDYLLDGILQRRFFYSMSGKTGSGKTAIALLLAASTALGRPIGDIAAEQGRVIYLAGENPVDVQMRWIALAQQMDFDPETIDVHFRPGAFKISELIDQIKAEVQALGGASLIIVDTNAAFYEGDDENSNTQQGTPARRLRSLVEIEGGPCALVPGHPAKNASDDNLQPRGGSSFIAEVDGNLSCRKDDSVVELHWQGKFRGPDFTPISFKLRTVTHERLKDTKGPNDTDRDCRIPVRTSTGGPGDSCTDQCDQTA